MKTKKMTLGGRALCAALALALTAGLVPGEGLMATAYAAPEGAAEQDALQVHSEDVALDQLDASAEVAEEPTTDSGASAPSEAPAAGDGDGAPATADDAAADAVAPKPTVDPEDMLSIQVSVGRAEGAAGAAIAYGGLAYALNEDGASVSLIGWTGAAPKGALVIPAQVNVGQTEYPVTAIAGIADAASAEPAPGVTAVSIPASVERVDATFFQLFPNAAALTVDAANPVLQSYNGMLFDEGLTRLLLVPEGMEGAAVLPVSMASVPACAFTRCTKLSAIEVPAGGTSGRSFSTENGILYTADKATLLAAPAGLGASASIAAECTAIAAGAFWGNEGLETIVSSAGIVEITSGGASAGAASAEGGADAAAAPVPAFNDATISNATVFASERAAWEAAGFTRFAEAPEPGAAITPAEGSGFAFELLDSMTLAVRWHGGDPAPAALDIPAYGIIDGVRYAVSTIAENGFAGQEGIAVVDMPASITAIGAGAFEGCANLRTVHLSDAITALEARTFAGTALCSVVLPASLQAVAPEALAGLAGTTIVARTEVAEVSSQALGDSSDISIYAPLSQAGSSAWPAGLPAAGNHVLLFGVELASRTLTLEQGQSANLYEDGMLAAPGSIEVGYTYKANPVSVADDGTITAKMPGNASVGVNLSLTVEETVVNAIRSEEATLEQASFTTASADAAAPGSLQTIQHTVMLASAAVPVSTLAAAASDASPRATTYIRNMKAYGDVNIWRQTGTDGASYGAAEEQGKNGYVPYLQVQKITFSGGSVVLEGLYAPPETSTSSGAKRYYKLGVNKNCNGVSNVWYRLGDGIAQSVKSGTSATVTGATDIKLYLNYTAAGAGVSPLNNTKVYGGSNRLYRSGDRGLGFGAKGELQTASAASAYVPFLKVMKIEFRSGSVFLEGYYTSSDSPKGERRVYKLGADEACVGIKTAWYRIGNGVWRSIASGGVVDTAGATSISLYLNWTNVEAGVSNTKRNANFRSGTGVLYRAIDAGSGGVNPPSSEKQTATEKTPYTPYIQTTRLSFTAGSVFAEGFYAPLSGGASDAAELGRMRTYQIGTNTAAAGVTSVYYTIGDGPVLRLGSGASVDLTGKADVKVYVNWAASAVGVQPKKNLYGYAGGGRLFRITDADDGHAVSRGEWQNASLKSAYYPNLCVNRISFSAGSVYISGFYAEAGNETGELRVWKLGMNESCAGVNNVWYSVDDGLLQPIKQGASVAVSGQVKLYLDWMVVDAGQMAEMNLKVYAGGGKLHRVANWKDGFAAESTEVQTATKDKPYRPYLSVSRLFFKDGSVFLEGFYAQPSGDGASENGKLVEYKLGLTTACAGVSRLMYRIEGGDMMTLARGNALDVGGRQIELFLDWSRDDAGVAAERNMTINCGDDLWRSIDTGTGSGFGSLEQQRSIGYVPFLQVVRASYVSGSIFLEGYLIEEGNDGDGQLRIYKIGVNEACDGVTHAWYRTEGGIVRALAPGSHISLSGEKVTLYLNWKSDDEGVSSTKNISIYSSTGKIIRRYSNGGDWLAPSPEYDATADRRYRPDIHATKVVLGSDGALQVEGFHHIDSIMMAYQIGVKATFDGITTVKYRLGETGELKTLQPGVLLDIAACDDARLYLGFTADSFTVSLDANGGELAAGTITPQAVELGFPVVVAGVPVREGFTFAGWATDKAGASKYDPALPVLSDLTLYAQWIHGDYYEVRFYAFTDDASGDASGAGKLDVFRDNEGITADYAGLSFESKVTMPRQHASNASLPSTPYVTEAAFGHHMSDWSASAAGISPDATFLSGSEYAVSDLVPYIVDTTAAGTVDDPFVIDLYAGWVLDISMDMPTDEAIDVKMDGLANEGQAESELAIVSNTPAEMKVGAKSALQTGTPAYDVLLNGSEERATAADIDDSVQFSFAAKGFPANGSSEVAVASGWDIAAADSAASERLAGKLALTLGDVIHMDWDAITHAGPARWENLSTITWTADLADPSLRTAVQLLERP